MFRFVFSWLMLCSCLAAMDMIIYNARVYTADPNYADIEAVAIRDRRIFAVGRNDVILKLATMTTKVIDAKHKTLLPGFNDAHLHFLSGGKSLLELDLAGCEEWNEIKAKVLQKVQQTPKGGWITGRGWDHTLFNGGEWPTKEMLDEIAPAHPVFLRRIDGHVGWANSAALERCGISKTTQPPQGGEILIDSVTGCPTGIFKESAMDLITPFIPVDSPAFERQALKKALEKAAHLGVTSIQDNSQIESLVLYQELFERGELTVRVSEWLDFAVIKEPQRLKQIKKHYQSMVRENYIQLGLLKGFVDGTLGSRTAALFEPYSDQSDIIGILQYAPSDLEQLVATADRLGFQIGLHCIGDKANNMALNAYEKAIYENEKRHHRHRIEHAQVLHDGDAARFAELGAIASMQPTHCTSDLRWAEDRLGTERCHLAYAWKSILDAGGILAFGTDWPVEPLDPMRGLYSATSRRNIESGEPASGWIPEQCLSLEEAINCYTVNSAYAEFQEQVKGSITPGKVADLVLLSRDIFSCSHHDILDTRVELTIFDGRIIYSGNADFD